MICGKKSVFLLTFICLFQVAFSDPETFDFVIVGGGRKEMDGRKADGRKANGRNADGRKADGRKADGRKRTEGSGRTVERKWDGSSPFSPSQGSYFG